MKVTVDLVGKYPKVKQVIVKKLRRYKVWGFAYKDEGIIEIDPRCIGRKHMEILLHEAAHITLPYLEEEVIEHHAAELTRVLWDQGYRKYDNDTSTPLQDETGEEE